MSDLRTISPDELPEITEIPEDLRALVFSPGGPLQAVNYERLLTKLIATNLSKPTKAAVDADLAHPADSVALVFGDPTPALNGWYRKLGASGAGSWEQFEELARNARIAAEAAVQLASDEADRAAQAVTDVIEQGEDLLDAVRLETANIDRRFFASAALPMFNGELPEATEFGRFVTSGITNLVGAGSAAFMFGPSTNGFFLDIALEQYDILNRSPTLFGRGGATVSRVIQVGYLSAASTTAANRRRFFFRAAGESGRVLNVLSAQMPPSARGPFALFPDYDGTNARLDVCDMGTGSWHMGTPTPPSAGWVGVNALSGEHTYGARFDDAIGIVPTATRQGISWLRGAIGDFFFADGLLTLAQREAIINGADVAATIAAAGGTLRRHFPIVDANGRITGTGTGTRSITLVPEGTLLPGPNLRRQSAATYLTIDRLPWPAHIVRDPETGSHRIRLTGRTAGLSGRMWCDLVSTETNVRLRPRFQVFPTITGNAFSVWVEVPGTITDFEQIQLRFESNPAIVGATHPFVLQSRCGEILGQSEVGIALSSESTDLTGNGAAPAILPAADLRKFWFTTGRTITPDSGSTITTQGMMSPALPISTVGANMVLFANLACAAGEGNLLLACQAVSGTSLIHLMDDTQPGRSSADYKARLALAANRGRRGELLCEGRVIDWDAFFPGSTHGLMQNVYQPFLTGRGWPNAHVTRVDFWLGDGSISRRAVNVVMPCNRVVSNIGAANSDAGFEGQQRDDMRNWSHDLGYLVGPERIAHTMQGESGGALSGTEQTHPGFEPANTWQGDREYAYLLFEGLIMAFGKGRYRGPRFTESMRPGAAANEVIVRIGPPRPHPGVGVATVSNARLGFSTTSGAVVPPTPAEPLYPKVAGGNVKWNFEARIANGGQRGVDQIVSAELLPSGDEVRLVLAANRVPGQTTVWTLDGSPGRYPVGTVSQDAWRAGILHYGGTGHVDGTPEATGFSIAGSSQGVVLPA